MGDAFAGRGMGPVRPGPGLADTWRPKLTSPAAYASVQRRHRSVVRWSIEKVGNSGPAVGVSVQD